MSGVVAPKAEVALKAVGFAGVFLGLCVRSSAFGNIVGCPTSNAKARCADVHCFSAVRSRKRQRRWEEAMGVYGVRGSDRDRGGVGFEVVGVGLTKDAIDTTNLGKEAGEIASDSGVTDGEAGELSQEVGVQSSLEESNKGVVCKASLGSDVVPFGEEDVGVFMALA